MHTNFNGSDRENTTKRVVFFVNGKKIEDDNVDPEWTVLHYLRNKLRLCGTKLACGEGGCGACTVMLSKYDRTRNKITHIPLNACLAPICAIHGFSVTTIEGIGSTKTKLHPAQERIAKSHGSQCGFCTPGIVMSLYTLLRNTSGAPKMKEILTSFQGNLCRCTGYRPILEGCKTFTCGENCCTKLFQVSEFAPYHHTQEVIFPPHLKITNQYDEENLVIRGANVTWYRPASLELLLNLKNKHPEAKLIAGSTEISVEIKHKHKIYPKLIHLNHAIKELRLLKTAQTCVEIGANATLSELQIFLEEKIETLPEFKTRNFKALLEMLDRFGGKQIRSVGTIGGNIINASPISDLIPVLLACRAQLHIQSRFNTRTIEISDGFFLGNRLAALKTNEILVGVEIPYSKQDQFFYFYKQSRRRDDDITIVNTAINVIFHPQTRVIVDIVIAFGGVTHKCCTAEKTRAKLIGKQWNSQTLEIAYDCLMQDFPLRPDSPGGLINYRKTLILSLFYKGFLSICLKLPHKLNPREFSGASNFKIEQFKSAQYFTQPFSKSDHDTVQKPIVHKSAFKQATGEAIYCDDLPKLHDELYLAFVFSAKPHAKITKIDATKALNLAGVHDFICAQNLEPKLNKIGAVFLDERIFYNEIVTACGQIIGAVVGDDQSTARKAAKLVHVHYEELSPVILTIKDAIKYKSYFSEPYKVLENGDIDEVLKNAPHVLEGNCSSGGQEHFYFETQVCLCVPNTEDGGMEIYASTQNPAEISKVVARVLGVHQNKIICKTKRLGGGFGGKESKATNFSIPVAIAAAKLKRPIRVMLDRDEDIISTGGRHPFYTKYTVGFDDQGKILGCDVQMFNNCGHSLDLSLSVLQRAMIHFENCYKIPAVRVTGFPCKTNLPSNTAFRGFGAPQGMFVAETIVRDISDFLKKDAAQISEINLYKEGDLTHYNQKLINCTAFRCWDEVIRFSNYHTRKNLVDDFNKENRYKKRGISVIPTKYGIAFTAPFLNQGGALIMVYQDGSVLLSHGGVEMGQGLHTKMIQIAGRVLEIPIQKIHVIETSTDKVPNTSPTAASSSSDINGMAVIEACEVIKERLRPFKQSNPKATWEELIQKAYSNRVNLTACGFYKTPDVGYNWSKKTGNMFNYFTYGSAVTEVEIDTLTGGHNVIRTDIVMDLGESLNPAIDVGQIEGAFIQGYGLFVMEEMVYTLEGSTSTKGPSTYKIPGFCDVPQEFNVSLLKESGNPRAVYSSKAVGEPPLFLASSVLFAIREAINAARYEFNSEESFRLDAPATAEKIRMACQDEIARKFQGHN